MFGLKDLSVSFLSSSPWLVILAAVVLVALAAYHYRRTNPPLPRYLRILLGTLRVIAIAALILSLLQPVISYTREFERPQRVNVVLDESFSMDRLEPDRTRIALRDSLLSSEAFARLRSGVDLQTFYFGGNLTLSRQLVDRDQTAIGDALRELGQLQLTDPVDHFLLLSDGRSNSGIDPAESTRRLGSPVIAVDMSVPGGHSDMSIADLGYNPVLFAGQQTEIRVKLNWQDVPDTRLTVGLYDSARAVAQAAFVVDQSEGLGEVVLKYTPDEPGQKILQVAVPALENEENTRNNRRSFSVKVLKGRLAVLLASESPDYELGFLKRYLEKSEKYDVDLIVTGTKAGNLAGVFPTGQAELNRYDLVVLHDPDPAKLESRREVIESYLSDRGGGVWILMADRFSRARSSSWLDELLPFHPSRSRGAAQVDFHAEPSESNLFHPAVRLADDQAGIRRVWAELPPFQSLVVCDRTHPEAVVLASAGRGASANDRLPAIGYRRIGAGKLFASAALPYWTWGFVSLGYGDDPTRYDRFVDGVVSWLTVSDDLDPVRVGPEKHVFSRGEEIGFDGHAYDLSFRPLPGVVGTVKLESRGMDQSYEVDLIQSNPGQLRGEFENVVPGDYSYVASLYKDEQLLKETRGRLQVEPFSLEEYDQSGDPALLKAVARLSGGSYFEFSQFDGALDAIDVTPLKVSKKGEIILFNKLWILLIFVIAVSVEWLLRKVNQLL